MHLVQSPFASFIHRISWLALSCSVLATSAWAEEPPHKPQLPYQNPALTPVERAKDLVGRMTQEEKLPQLINDAPAIPRLGVREFNWWNEGLHGVAAMGEATVFPQAIGMAAAWDAPLLKQAASVVSTEFRAKHFAKQHRFGGSDWFEGLSVWSPNINIFRDPRWGRGQETYGEDPYLTARLGVAYVQGLQGDDPRYLKTIATPKHFAVHSGPEASRHKDNVNPSPKDLEETYLPAFAATVKEAKAGSIMCAYNAINGVPACANQSLLKETLRGKWGFDGYVVSDCAAVYDIYHGKNHAYTSTPEEGIKAAFDAGMDLICGDSDEADHIHSALKKGLISEQQIDISLVRLFTARMRLGQFDPRPAVFPTITAGANDTPENRKVAQTLAEKSIVLLKNHNNFLPLSPTIKTLAVIGPNADSQEALVGNYNGSPSHPVTLLNGLQKRFGASAIRYAPGTGLLYPLEAPVPSTVLCADAKCKKPGLKAEYFTDKNLGLKPVKQQLETSVQVTWKNEVRSSAMRWSGYLKAPETGTYTLRYKADGGYRIWVNDQLIIDAWKLDWRAVIASGSIELTAGKIYSLKVESFQRGEQGNEQLIWSTPSNLGAQAALAAANASDAIIFAGGLTAQVEGEEMPVPMPGFVGGDRTDLALPGGQRALLQQLYATGKPVIVVLMNGSALAVNEEDTKAVALLEAWYPGGQGGDAIAAVLAGDVSPAGRLPVTFYKSVEQLPDFNDYSMSSRTYRYHKNPVLYPFGYGLSYSQFRYGDIKVQPTRWKPSGTLKLNVSVTNTGGRDADEVVQLYLARPDIPGTPVRALAGFQRISIAKGATANVTFELQAEALSTVDDRGKRSVVPGKAEIWIGGGQPDVREGLPVTAGSRASVQIQSGLAL
ncbi:MAG TPA: glycoside hydrolase family 3 C-terminal domain-containing protein [Cellvibrionaceae bacterium]